VPNTCKSSGVYGAACCTVDLAADG
jgi:hypothetical protein